MNLVRKKQAWRNRKTLPKTFKEGYLRRRDEILTNFLTEGKKSVRIKHVTKVRCEREAKGFSDKKGGKYLGPCRPSPAHWARSKAQELRV